MAKFKEINNLYKIKEVTEEYLVSQLNKKDEKVYIYEVIPMLLLDMSINIQNNIISIYNQLLRLCNFNFQILICNKKLDIREYILKYYNKLPNVPEELYLEYIKDMKLKLQQETMYETHMYIVISENFKTSSKIEEYEKTIYKLEEVGCKINKLTGLKEYENILYKTINKVEV